jgi:hypothetical protein
MISREDLYELVWSMPMTKAAKRFLVSGSYLARICALLRVPRPKRGYWAKLEVGKAPVRPVLPEAQSGDQLFWSQEGDPPAPRVRAEIATTTPPKLRVHRSVTGIHGLIQGAKQHYETGYKIEEGQLLRPYKRHLVDVTASVAGLDKALAFANDLFNAFESAGHRVCFAPSSEPFRRPRIDAHEAISKSKSQEYPYNNSHLWAPSRPTVVYVGTVPFGLAIIEMTEAVLMRYLNGKYIRESDYRPPKISRGNADYTWTTTENIPCGRLRLVVYSPYRDISWSMSFQEKTGRALTHNIAMIVRSIENSTEQMRKEIVEAEQRAEAWRQEQKELQARWAREEDQRQIARSIKESREQLEQVIQSWAAAVSIEQFFIGVEERASILSEAERGQALERLQLAREFIGTQDPLDFFRSWKSPSERYKPMAERNMQRNTVNSEDGPGQVPSPEAPSVNCFG